MGNRETMEALGNDVSDCHGNLIRFCEGLPPAYRS
jgi:hypothetical protein